MHLANMFLLLLLEDLLMYLFLVKTFQWFSNLIPVSNLYNR